MIWTDESIVELNEIVSYMKESTSGELLEFLANDFIKRHSKFIDINNYSMEFSPGTNTQMLGDGEYKLAFICELSTLYHGKFNIKRRKVKNIEKVDFGNVYKCLCYMIKYALIKNYYINFGKANYNESYLTTLLKDNIVPWEKIKTKDDPLLNQLIFPYHLVKEIIDLSRNRPNIIYALSSLMSESQNLDLSILSSAQIQNIKDILKNKRTIYVRFLLVLTFEILKIPKILEVNWLLKRVNFNNRNEFVDFLTSPVIETILFITAMRIA